MVKWLQVGGFLAAKLFASFKAPRNNPQKSTYLFTP